MKGLDEDALEKLGLEEVLTSSDYGLFRRGQRYGIGWQHTRRSLYMLHEMRNTTGRITDTYEEVTSMLFQTDGQFKLWMDTCGIDETGNFSKFLGKVRKYLEEEEQQ